MAKTATPRHIIKLIERRGFVFSRQSGSHAIYVNVEGVMIIIPMHARDLAKGTLNRILKLAGLTIKDLK